MNLNDYQQEAMKTNLYPPDLAVYALALGLTGEAGEVANVVKRVARDWGGSVTLQAQEALKFELGDVLWYLACLSSELGLTLDEVAEYNLIKLKDRADRNVIKGEGDKR